MPVAILPHRSVLEITGEDRVSFLQGLVSNDVAAAAPGHAVWAAMLTPQGKWLADFFVFAETERLLLDVERDQAPMLLQKLSRFRLRSKVALRDLGAAFTVHAGWGGAPLPEGMPAAPDPRLDAAGWRALAPVPPPGVNATAEDWDRHRLTLGLPDGPRDLEPEATVLLEAGFDELNGVSWTKGCYMGQELTARTRYRGLVKRRLVPVRIAGAPPARGTPVLDAAGIEVGEIRSGREGLAIAQLRLDALERGTTLTASGAVVTPEIPGWMRLGAKTPA